MSQASGTPLRLQSASPVLITGRRTQFPGKRTSSMVPKKPLVPVTALRLLGLMELAESTIQLQSGSGFPPTGPLRSRPAGKSDWVAVVMKPTKKLPPPCPTEMSGTLYRVTTSLPSAVRRPDQITCASSGLPSPLGSDQMSICSV